MINTDPATIVRNQVAENSAEKEWVLDIANSAEARRERVDGVEQLVEALAHRRLRGRNGEPRREGKGED